MRRIRHEPRLYLLVFAVGMIFGIVLGRSISPTSASPPAHHRVTPAVQVAHVE